jgi:Glycosyltransferase sugar-binding region containing DXD motif
VQVPSVFHFIHLNCPESSHERRFSLVHYLAIESCRQVNRPEVMNLYFNTEPSGQWWERARPYLNLIPVKAPEEIFGIPLRHPAHKADVLRLQVLLETGGIYLDLDVLCLRPFAALQKFDVVLGEECGVGLCNAVILAKPNAQFIQRWLEGYRTFSADDWNGHSVRLPMRLAREMPEHIHIVDCQKFFWPMYWEQHRFEFFLNSGSTFCSNSFCVHLWEAVTSRLLQRLTPPDLWASESEFCILARKYLPPDLGRNVVGRRSAVDRK